MNYKRLSKKQILSEIIRITVCITNLLLYRGIINFLYVYYFFKLLITGIIIFLEDNF